MSAHNALEHYGLWKLLTCRRLRLSLAQFVFLSYGLTAHNVFRRRAGLSSLLSVLEPVKSVSAFFICCDSNYHLL